MKQSSKFDDKILIKYYIFMFFIAIYRIKKTLAWNLYS